MHLILRDRVRSRGAVGHVADEQDSGVAPKILQQFGGYGAFGIVEIDMSMIGGIGLDHRGYPSFRLATPPKRAAQPCHSPCLSDRKNVVSGKSVSLRAVIGVRRYIKQKIPARIRNTKSLQKNHLK